MQHCVRKLYLKYRKIFGSSNISVHLLSVYLSVCLSLYRSVCFSLCLSVSLSVSLSVCLSVCSSVCLSLCLSLCLSVCLYVCLTSVCLFVCLSLCLSVSLSVHLSVCLSVCLCLSVSVCLSVSLFVSLSVCPSVCLFICFFVLTLCLLSISLPPLSHTGRAITELSVPGVRLQLLKRPYDTKLEFAVQDLCVVDCIQTFGPQFELVVCSSGKTILASSYPQEKPTRPSSAGKGEDSSYSVNSVRFHNISSATRPGDSTLAPPEGSSAHAPQSSHEDTEYVFSPDTEGAELLSLSPSSNCIPSLLSTQP